MSEPVLSVREISQQDIVPLTQYWVGSNAAFMRGMGVDMNKMLNEEQWREMLSEQLSQPYSERKSYCIIWQVDGKAVGHSNVNKIIFGKEAYMHLHLWNTSVRKKRNGHSISKNDLALFL